MIAVVECGLKKITSPLTGVILESIEYNERVINDSITITQSVFHIKGLRRILALPSTFLEADRHYTNEYVLRKANEALKSEKGKEIMLMSEYHTNAELKD